MDKSKSIGIWEEFLQKLEHDTFTSADFSAEMCAYLQPFLCGEHSAFRRQKYLNASYDIYESVNGMSVISHCADDDYRFDFVSDGISWKLTFIECITLPVYDMDSLPYSEFVPLEKKELHIRREKEISRLVYFYLKFKELVGKEMALSMFHDGKGECIGARSWVPFYSDSLSCIAYFAWCECRINGENVVVREFSESKCEMIIYNHIWRTIYFTVGHLKPVIEYPDYMELFEAIWKDRAVNAGWEIEFAYTGADTSLIFKHISREGV